MFTKIKSNKITGNNKGEAMKRIIIPTNYSHIRTTPFWTRETAPKSIWER
ncbi:hypothetical protein ACK4SH_33345, partial [Proteus mirabilis]